jgi:hypothetical protein
MKFVHLLEHKSFTITIKAPLYYFHILYLLALNYNNEHVARSI